jgi:protein gp37
MPAETSDAMTTIEWVRSAEGVQGVSWNPVTGCDHGCTYCYARRMARRLKAMGQQRYRNGFKPTFHAEALGEPLRWRKPRTVFVASMSDLFDPAFTDGQIAAVFGVMAACPQHTFQLLTKQAKEMRAWFEWAGQYGSGRGIGGSRIAPTGWTDDGSCSLMQRRWPLPNLWLGVSVELPEYHSRIDNLRETPAAVRFISFEPLLAYMGPMRLDGIDWVIVGSDSTRGSPELPLDWVRSIRDQCRGAGVPFFFKQRHASGRKISMPELDGRTWAEMPEAPCAT